MKSAKYSGKQRISRPFFIRRIVGKSMKPFLKEDMVVFSSSLLKPKEKSIIIFKHQGLIKIKYIDKITTEGLYVLGLNATNSTDSRTFGLIEYESVLGRVIWPRIHNLSTSYSK